MNKKKPPMMADGIMILNDLDNTKNVKKPAIMQNVAVRVPEANICQVTSAPVIKKKKRSLLILVVMLMTKNKIAAPAA